MSEKDLPINSLMKKTLSAVMMNFIIMGESVTILSIGSHNVFPSVLCVKLDFKKYLKQGSPILTIIHYSKIHSTPNL